MNRCVIAILCAAFLAAAAVPTEVTEGFKLTADGGQNMTLLLKSEPSNKQIPDFISVEAQHLGKNYMLFRTVFARKPDFAVPYLIYYLNYDNDPNTGRKNKYHGGVDIQVFFGGNACNVTPQVVNYPSCGIKAVLLETETWFLLEFPVHKVGTNVEFSIHLLAQNRTGINVTESKITKDISVKVPYFDGSMIKGKLKLGKGSGFLPLSYYGYHNNKIALLPLSNKGLTAAQVKRNPPFKPGRECPRVSLPSGAGEGRPATVARQRVTFNLTEEAGVARSAASVRFGMPFPKGMISQTAQMRVLDPGGAEVPAQFAVMCRWPDDSLKWCLVQFDAKLPAGASQDWTLEFGNDVKRAETTGLIVRELSDTYVVDTGAAVAKLDRRAFSFAEVTPKGGKTVSFNVRFNDENGHLFTTKGLPPKEIRLEENGTERVVIRVAGDYGAADGAKLMSYVARLTFHKGSPILNIDWTHINTEIEHEFTDVTSLELDISGTGPLAELDFACERYNKEVAITATPADGKLALFQLDDVRAQYPKNDGTAKKNRLASAFLCKGTVGTIGVAIRDLWKRWPKALTMTANGITLGILPPQPDTKYGQDLAFWLVFPFRNGKYRTKWGMAFTERILVDCAGNMPRDELAAEADWPPIAVISADWYDRCKVFGDIAVPQGSQFSMWDEWFADCMKRDAIRREKQHEYGYFNYGDSFGERGRNWTNNEYDYAHGQFMQFLRTGNRLYYRRGMAAARHQADVDIVHAYPDAFYIGSNHQHSIGHTGQWSQNPERATWTYRYDTHTDARNGHTWLEGMTEAWCLAADPRAMESAYELGEHIVWAMSYDFKQLGTHERTAGWSLKASMALYKQFGDPLYLDAAKRIVEVPLREQKFDNGGAWPHVLPRDHSGKEPGAVGNCMFLLGTLLTGMKDYYEVTKDPRIPKSIVSAAHWIMRSYDKELCGWPYTAKVDGTPLWRTSPGESSMVPQVIAYAGVLSGEKQFIDAARDTIEMMLSRDKSSAGKAIAYNTQLNVNAIALLQRWYAKHRPTEAASLMSGSLAEARYRNAYRNASNAKLLRFRSPNNKVILVRLKKASAVLTLERQRVGAMPKRDENATVIILDATDKEAARGTCSTDDELKMPFTLHGNPGDVFTVKIHDDQRGVWGASSPDAQVMGKLVSASTFGAVGNAFYHFLPPAGTTKFRVKLTGIHQGTFGCVIYDSGGKVVKKIEGIYSGSAQIVTLDGVKESNWYDVDTTDYKTGLPWSIMLYATQDIGLEFDGIPPYIATSADQLFFPTK